MAVVQSVAALGVGKYRAGNMDQLRREWEQYNDVGHLSDEGVIGLFADQLIRMGRERDHPFSRYMTMPRSAASTLGEQSAHSATPSF